MYKLIFIAFLISGYLLASPESKNNPKTNIPGKYLPKTTYRLDQFSPGVISEYIWITRSRDRSRDRSKIMNIKYWYIYRNGGSTEETKPVEIKFRKGEKYEKEEVGYAGELLLSE